MKSPLIIDPEDKKWLLLERVLSVTTSRRAKQEMAKAGLTPVANTGSILRLMLMALFFSVDITYMVDELRNRAELRRFANIVHIPSADTVYRFISSINEDQFVGLINALLRTECMNPRWHKNRTYLIDSTAITLDLNIFKKRYTRSDLVEKDYAWGYSTTNGYYLGYKLTLVVEYPTLIPVAFFLHRGSPGDARLLAEVLNELSRRRLLLTADRIVCDRGYYSYNNYAVGVLDFKVIPIIFPKKGFEPKKMLRRMNYPLRIFSQHDYRKTQKVYDRPVRTLLRTLERWEDFMGIRSLIEDLFKLAKESFSLRKLHRYSRVSVQKIVAVSVLLVGATVSAGINKKTKIQKVAEW